MSSKLLIDDKYTKIQDNAMLAYMPTEINPFSNTVLITFASLFFIDLIMSINTSYYNKGVLETRRLEILYNYIMTYLKYDIIVILALLVMIIVDVDYIALIIFLKIDKFISLFKKMKE